jgi:hypothetical protein
VLVRDGAIVEVVPTGHAQAHGVALALPEYVTVARPAGVGRALTTYRIPIEGRDEWVAPEQTTTA